MAAYSYGLLTTDFVEVADPSDSNQAVRPTVGTPLILNDAVTGQPVTGLVDGSGAPVTEVITTERGYFRFGCSSPQVLVSADGGTIFKLLTGLEAITAAVGSASQSAAALAAATQAQSQVAQALSSQPQFYTYDDATDSYIPVANMGVYMGPNGADPKTTAGSGTVGPADLWLKRDSS